MSSTGKRVRPLKPEALGFSLVETVIAIAVIGLAFIGIIGLLGLGVANDQTSTEQTVATNIAASILADFRSTPNYAPKSTRFTFAFPPSNAGTPPFSGITPSYLYFDNSANWLPLGGPILYTSTQATVPSGAAFMATVYLAQTGTVGPTASPQSSDIARIVITWPPLTSAQITAGIAPSGNVDIISQFLVR